MPFGNENSCVTLTTFCTADKIQDGTIPLASCALPDLLQHPNLISGFYGFNSTAGIAFANYIAELHKTPLRSVVIQIPLENSLRTPTTKPEDIPNIEMLHCCRLSAKMVAILADFWRERMEAAGWEQEQLEEINWRRPEHFIPKFEQGIVDLYNEPQFQHCKLIIYPARPQTIRSVLDWFAVGVTRPQHIKSAHVRYGDDIKVLW